MDILYLCLLSSGRVIVCIIFGIAHAQKSLGCKKNTWFCSIQCYTQNETIPKNKVKNFLFEFWRALARAVTHAVMHLSSDGGGT